jgi:predicted AlkP superfamily phosphohydrolase/phosphomutase
MPPSLPVGDGVYERVFIFEMAGPTLDFLDARRESLPNIGRFMDRGAWSRLRGPLQPGSPQSFATLLTGMNPGSTGLFDTFRFAAGGYDRVPSDAGALRRPCLHEILSRHDKRVGLLNVPLTVPLRPVNGFVVSGDEGVGEGFAYPAEVRDALAADGYVVPFGASYAAGREREFADHALGVLAMRRRAALKLFGDGHWQFGMLTLHLYGELLHAFWKFYDERHPDYRPAADVFGGRDPLLEALRAVDELLGELVALAGPRGLVIFMGAWGHRLVHSKAHLNAALARSGDLCFRRDPRTQLKRAMFRLGVTSASAERLAHRLNLWKLFHYKLARGQRAKVTGAAFLSYRDIDWSRTRAVAMGSLGQVYLNVRGHRPHGVIPPERSGAERERLGRLLSDLRDPRNGEPVVERVLTREEIYRGEEVTHAPDLVVEWRAGYAGDGGLSGAGKVVAPAPPNLSSDHWNESAFLALGPDVGPGELTAALEDVTPTVLHALGVPIPAGLDGTVLPLWARA